MTVTVDQVITNPSIVATPGAPDSGTGAVVITTAVTPQTIPVTVTAAHSGNGTLVDNGNGTWTYTPSDPDRTAASQVGAPVTYETITFTATNTTDPTKVGTDAVDVAIEPLVNTVIGSYDVDHPWSVAVSADGKTAYVTSIYNGVVSIVNTKTGAITPIQLAAGSEPVSAVLNPSDGSIYVPNFVAGRWSGGDQPRQHLWRHHRRRQPAQRGIQPRRQHRLRGEPKNRIRPRPAALR